jgi:phasin protein
MAGKTTRAEHRSQTPVSYLTDLARFEGPMTQIWIRPLEVCLRWQADMLKATEPLAMGWFERQLETTHMTLETIEKLSNCSDLNEAVSIQREWFDRAAKRLTVELEKLAEQATSLSREAVAATRGAVQAVSEAAASPKQPAPRDTQINAAA